MDVHDALADLYERIRHLVHATVQGLDPQALAWRPDAQSNSVAWLVWHLTRVQDDHVAEIAGVSQVWTTGGWAERFGLPTSYADTGYGHSAEEVAAIAPNDPQLLIDYHDEVAEQTARYLAARDVGDLDRVIDRSYDPPVTVGVRLLSVTEDSLQHVGQAAYLRGLAERRAPQRSAAGGDVGVEDLPAELRSRVDAATAHAAHRRVRALPAEDDRPAVYVVEAVAGDRITTMELELRADGSVGETTRSVAAGDVADVRRRDDGVGLVVRGTPDAPTIVVSADAAAAAGLEPRS